LTKKINYQINKLKGEKCENDIKANNFIAVVWLEMDGFVYHNMSTSGSMHYRYKYCTCTCDVHHVILFLPVMKHESPLII